MKFRNPSGGSGVLGTQRYLAAAGLPWSLAAESVRMRSVFVFLRGTTEPTVTAWRPSALRQLAWLIGFIVLCFASAGLGAAATATSVGGWYQTLAKPSWNPPDWLFGPVWSLLYLMMAVAAWLVWRGHGWRAARPALTWFGIQLALNVTWSFLFFGLHRPGPAFAEIVALWLSIAATCLAFREKSVNAVLLLIPYLAWTSFAVILNFAIWRMN